MKTKWIYLGMVLLTFLGIGCSDNNSEDEIDIPDVEGETPVALEAPSDLKVATCTYNTAILLWKGNADKYEIRLNNETIVELEGTSFGTDMLQSQTVYTWEVRGIRGEEYTEWVAGKSFTTSAYVDFREDWCGKWMSQNWNVSLLFSGSEISLNDFLPNLPENALNELLALLTFEIEKEGEMESNLIRVSSPLLSPLELPLSFTIPIDNGELRLDIPRTDTIPVLKGASYPLADFPFISEIDGVKDLIQNNNLNDLELLINQISIELGPIEVNQGLIPARISVSAGMILKTDSEIINMLINFFDPKLNGTVTADLIKKE